jgi:hypothetical protein
LGLILDILAFWASFGASWADSRHRLALWHTHFSTTKALLLHKLVSKTMVCDVMASGKILDIRWGGFILIILQRASSCLEILDFSCFGARPSLVSLAKSLFESLVVNDLVIVVSIFLYFRCQNIWNFHKLLLQIFVFQMNWCTAISSLSPETSQLVTKFHVQCRGLTLGPFSTMMGLSIALSLELLTECVLWIWIYLDAFWSRLH